MDDLGPFGRSRFLEIHRICCGSRLTVMTGTSNPAKDARDRSGRVRELDGVGRRVRERDSTCRQRVEQKLRFEPPLFTNHVEHILEVRAWRELVRRVRRPSFDVHPRSDRLRGLVNAKDGAVNPDQHRLSPRPLRSKPHSCHDSESHRVPNHAFELATGGKDMVSRQSTDGPNPGRKSANYLQGCTICFSCRCTEPCWIVPRRREKRTGMAGLPRPPPSSRRNARSSPGFRPPPKGSRLPTLLCLTIQAIHNRMRLQLSPTHRNC